MDDQRKFQKPTFTEQDPKPAVQSIHVHGAHGDKTPSAASTPRTSSGDPPPKRPSTPNGAASVSLRGDTESSKNRAAAIARSKSPERSKSPAARGASRSPSPFTPSERRTLPSPRAVAGVGPDTSPPKKPPKEVWGPSAPSKTNVNPRPQIALAKPEAPAHAIEHTALPLDAKGKKKAWDNAAPPVAGAAQSPRTRSNSVGRQAPSTGGAAQSPRTRSNSVGRQGTPGAAPTTPPSRRPSVGRPASILKTVDGPNHKEAGKAVTMSGKDEVQIVPQDGEGHPVPKRKKTTEKRQDDKRMQQTVAKSMSSMGSRKPFDPLHQHANNSKNK